MNPLQIRCSRQGTSDPFLSIVICSYNHGRYIEECLRSVNDMTRRDRVEVIIIDDGSRDDTLARALAFPFSSELALSVYTKPNAGLTNSLRYGLTLARGKYFMIIASDDYYLPGALDSLIEQLTPVSGPPICWVMQAVYAGDLGGPVYARPTMLTFALDSFQRLKRLTTEYPKPLLLQSTVFDREMLVEVDPWGEELLLDDWPTFIKVAEAAVDGKVVFDLRLDLVLCAYRVHSGGVHNNSDRQLQACLEIAHKVVPAKWRAQAVANIYSDLALVHLVEHRPHLAARFYWRALKADLALPTISRLPTKIVRGIYKRLARLRAASPAHVVSP